MRTPFLSVVLATICLPACQNQRLIGEAERAVQTSAYPEVVLTRFGEVRPDKTQNSACGIVFFQGDKVMNGMSEKAYFFVYRRDSDPPAAVEWRTPWFSAARREQLWRHPDCPSHP
jgi:hypothetical protein